MNPTTRPRPDHDPTVEAMLDDPPPADWVRPRSLPGAGDVVLGQIYRWGIWGWTWRMSIVVAVAIAAGYALFQVVPLP